ncbi:MAG: hypothetical protein LBR60_06715 [Fibrobacter sp.]|jgi:hypothetical protein|nr:hypothetical protein [Fibrobacter sp.]
MRFYLFLLLYFCSTAALFAESAVPDSSQNKTTALLEKKYPILPEENIAKGHILAGPTVSLLQAEASEIDVFIADLYELDGYTFTVEAFAGYFFRDGLAAGLRGGYERTYYTIDFDLLEDIADVSQRRKYMSNGFFVQPFLRNYLKIFDSHLIYFFNETNLKFYYSSGISQVDDHEDLTKAVTNNYGLEVGLNPGLTIFLTKGFAFETSIGLLGLSSNYITIEENGEKRSKMNYNIIDFKVSLLSLDFSLVYFF